MEKDANQVLGELIRTLTGELKKCKRQVSILFKSQDKLKQQINRHVNMVTRLQVECLKAAGRNEDERARELIRKRKRYEATVEQLKRQLGKHKSVSDTIQETVRKLELKLDEARRKKLLLVTQRQAFETTKRLTDGLHGRHGDLLEEIEDDVTFLQTETRLALDIDVDRIGLDEFDVDSGFAEPNLVTEDEELAELKRKFVEEGEDVKLLTDQPVPQSPPDEREPEPTEQPPEEPSAPAEDTPAEEPRQEDSSQDEEAPAEEPQQEGTSQDEEASVEKPATEDGSSETTGDERGEEVAAAPEKPAEKEPILIIDDSASAGPDLVITDDQSSQRRPGRQQPEPQPDIVFIDDD